MRLASIIAIAIGLSLSCAISGPSYAATEVRKEQAPKTPIVKIPFVEFHMDAVLVDACQVYAPDVTYCTVLEAKNNKVVPVATVTPCCNGPGEIA